MAEQHVTRKLAAIFYADVAGYSRLTGEDEEGTHRRVSTYLDAITDSIKKHNGTVLHFAGDAVLADFTTVSDALSCAVNTQADLKERNKDLPDNRKVQFRVGVNLGEVIVDRGEIFGNGVNVAARLESLAKPGGICISAAVYDAVGSKLPLDYEFMGEQSVKNIAEPVRAYSVSLMPDAALPEPSKRKATWSTRTFIALTAAAFVLVIGVGAIVWFAPWSRTIEPTSHETAALPLPDKPSIAVLPFINMSGNPERDYFSDGMTDDLITDLSKISGLFVIGRNASFAYKGTSPDVGKVSRELGVRYVLEGSVRRAGDTVRINAQLVDATTGGHLWAGRFDGALSDVFSLQDDVNQKIVSALAVTLTPDDRKRLDKNKTVNPDAYDALLRGLELIQRFNPEDNAEARAWFMKAIASDSNYARAYANVARTYAIEINMNWTGRREEAGRLGLEYAAQAVVLDKSIPQVYQARSSIYLSQRQYDAAITEAQRVVKVEPNSADGHAMLAFVLYNAGHLENALDSIRTAKRLDPKSTHVHLYIEGHILFLMGRYEAALPLFEKAARRNPAFDRAQILLAATYGQMGETESAAWAVEEALALRPSLSLADERRDALYKRPEDLKRYIDGLRKAELPD